MIGKNLVEDWLKSGDPLATMEKDINQTLHRERRERIAAAALQGLLSQSQYWSPHQAADEAIKHADALIERLDKEVKS